MKQIIPAYCKYCATCTRWGGERRPADPYLINVEYEDSRSGKCYGGGNNHLPMPALGTCSQWEQQYKK